MPNDFPLDSGFKFKTPLNLSSSFDRISALEKRLAVALAKLRPIQASKFTMDEAAFVMSMMFPKLRAIDLLTEKDVQRIETIAARILNANA